MRRFPRISWSKAPLLLGSKTQGRRAAATPSKAMGYYALRLYAPFAGFLFGAATLPPTAMAQASDQQTKQSRIYRSAYYLGRGDTGIAIADKEEAVFYNPAGIAAGKGIYKEAVLLSPQIEVSSATRDLARRLGAEQADAIDTVRDHIGNPIHFGMQNFTGLILRRVALGVVASSSTDLLAYKSKDQGALEVVEVGAQGNVGATFSLAEGFFNQSLLLGITTKYLVRGVGYASASTAEVDKIKDDFSDQSKFLGMGQGGGADLGLMYKVSGTMAPSFGMTIENVGGTKITPQEKTELDLDLKQTINFGFAIEPSTKFSKIRLLADYRDALGNVQSNVRKRIHLGGELTVKDMIGITGGLNQGYPSGGVYFDLFFARLDVGVYTEELSDRVGVRPDTRYVMRLKTGF